jgi:alpha-glucosidase (family GH31 glycosyl hydrolase)
MNEPSNFKGSEPAVETYRIQHSDVVTSMTMNTNAKHYNPNNVSNPLNHSEVHAYYGHLEVMATFKFLESTKQRPFIITRSNSVGTGRFAGHWTGDNAATWPFLRLSIGANFHHQIFGMQMVGSDICGFHSTTTPELCARWTQLGALYPFARNHNEIDSASQ